MTDTPLGLVEIVGTGPVGTSIALACRRAGIDVVLTDLSAEHVRTASGLGAGRPRSADDRPVLVVVAVPPDHLADAIVDALTDGDALVTDVGSIKSRPLHEVAQRVDAAQLSRYVGSHPMAGSERSGPLAASAALFDGRPWAITPHVTSSPEATKAVGELVAICGAVPTTLSPEEHDSAVARTSHLPHLAAVLVAGRPAGAPAEHLALSGRGVRDVTRIAASDPALWQQILGANADAVTDLLGELREQLDDLIAAVRTTSVGRCTASSAPASAARRPSPASTAARSGPCARCSCPSPTIPASWHGSSGTPARSA
ncbi:prephenate dehydrogenase [Nocardioides sp. B-3]|uniref:prephenate dehydrogenase n=1 Tax=Nocardioides sp. B-3 TaxID=2895565 RepID=UPI002152BB21|nr:prephenate dehydrogenase/arogenate dehydrogenase family protein [Nocardioides sp. B-3]UUZ59010.1 prephenate dehydrogenase/arogenate dehydrogenase family protein [Nocardioides sp. B-3]